ncbi:hypothetical protein SY27_12800 [Flavobacterium sp. 316]|uniref:hypothetical protein n=1 Tax=Flavobacterium sp. 316 TaxID=1603293 RepID=UPI0005E326D6|nr:hypothetical protein [Flavobacterium sp. 316]KIX20758.1 hypothetical protein SY27_12800 [Flavobacterium sp. 316]
MKKKLEAELISIAHRVLKLKNRSETKQLQLEAKKIYEMLTVLSFYEDNFETLKNEISQEELETKLENPIVSNNIEVHTKAENDIIPVQETENNTTKKQFEEPKPSEEKKEEIQKEENNGTAQPALFDGVLIEDYKEVDFVKVEEVPKEVEKIADLTFEKAVETIAEPVQEETKIIEKEKTSNVVNEEPKTMSLNDRLTRGINIGLNDRIAFEKKLFGGNPDDLNRVLSQLNTFDSFEEVKGFINDFIKPDYNNWDGKEEYETRFLEIIEKKFN